MWHVSSCSGVPTLRTAIHLLLTLKVNSSLPIGSLQATCTYVYLYQIGPNTLSADGRWASIAMTVRLFIHSCTKLDRTRSAGFVLTCSSTQNVQQWHRQRGRKKGKLPPYGWTANLLKSYRTKPYKFPVHCSKCVSF